MSEKSKLFEGVEGCDCPACKIARLKVENRKLRLECDALLQKVEDESSKSMNEEQRLKTEIARLREALIVLRMAVADDLRHGDDADEDRSWEALARLKSALEKAAEALGSNYADDARVILARFAGEKDGE